MGTLGGDSVKNYMEHMLHTQIKSENVLLNHKLRTFKLLSEHMVFSLSSSQHTLRFMSIWSHTQHNMSRSLHITWSARRWNRSTPNRVSSSQVISKGGLK